MSINEDIKLYTERFILRRYKLEDAGELYGIAKHHDVGPHAGWKPHESEEESLKIIKNIFFQADTFAITCKDSGRIIGTIALEKDRFRPSANSAELGYWCARDMWGKGVMTEAAMEVIKYGFKTRNLSQIGVCTSPVNSRSQRVIEKCGFTYEGTIRRTYETYDGTMRDSRVYSILKEEFIESKLP